MANMRLVRYIRSELGKGFSKEQIAQALLKNNYPLHDINHAMEVAIAEFTFNKKPFFKKKETVHVVEQQEIITQEPIHESSHSFTKALLLGFMLLSCVFTFSLVQDDIIGYISDLRTDDAVEQQAHHEMPNPDDYLDYAVTSQDSYNEPQAGVIKNSATQINSRIQRSYEPDDHNTQDEVAQEQPTQEHTIPQPATQDEEIIEPTQEQEGEAQEPTEEEQPIEYVEEGNVPAPEELESEEDEFDFNLDELDDFEDFWDDEEYDFLG